MTFQGTLKYVSYAGNDVTTSFAFNDKINDEAQLEVRISDPGNPEITVPDDSYTVTIDPGTGFATVDLDVAPSSIQTLFIRRAARNQQDTNWPLAGVINSEAANKQFDGDAMDRLSVQRQLDQAVKSNTTDFDGTFQPEASGFLAVTVDGKGSETRQGVPPDPSEIPAKSITSDKLADITATGTTTARAIEDRFADVVNVKDFGAVGDGVTDDTEAFKSVRDLIQTSTVSDGAGGANPIGTIKVFIPAGQYLITESGAIFDSSFTTRFRGIEYEGAGGDGTLSTILYKPTASGPLIDYNDSALGVSFNGIRFFCDDFSSKFMQISSSGGTQRIFFEQCGWFGQWNIVVHVNGGTDNGSELIWSRCSLNGEWDSYLRVEATDQNLNYWFNNCMYWPISTVKAVNWCDMQAGGHVRIDGCDVSGYEPVVPSNLFNLANPIRAQGTPNFYCSCRFELKNTNAAVMFCEWDFGNITWIGCDESSNTFSVASFETHRYRVDGSSPGVNVSFTGCHLAGKHAYQSGTGSFDERHHANYIGCQLAQEANIDSFIINDVPSNVGASWAIHFNGCNNSEVGGEGSVIEGDYNWNVSRIGLAHKRVLSLISPQGNSPVFGQSVTCKLPLNSVIKNVRMFMAAGAAGFGGVYDFTIETNEGTPTILGQAAGANLSLGFDVDNDYLFQCDTDEKRTLTLVDNALAAGGGPALFLVEYIG